MVFSCFTCYGFKSCLLCLEKTSSFCLPMLVIPLLFAVASNVANYFSNLNLYKLNGLGTHYFCVI